MRYLIVDGSKTMRIMIESVIKSFGDHDFLHANSVESALDILRDDRLVDWIILDYNMPGINGFECLKIIREISEFDTIKIVMCTSGCYGASVLNALNFGANAYLIKPFTRKQLLLALELLS